MNTLSYYLILIIAKANAQLFFVNKRFYNIYLKYAKGIPLYDYQINPTNRNLKRACEVNQYTDSPKNLFLGEDICFRIKRWNCGLEGANTGGHVELAKLMIDKGAENYSAGLKAAVINSHFQIVELMLNKCPKLLNYCIKTACSKNNIEMVKFLLYRRKISSSDMIYLIIKTGNARNIEIFKLLASFDWGWAIRVASMNGFLLPELITNNTNYDSALMSALEYNHNEIAQTLINLGADSNSGLVGACKAGNLDNVKWMINLGATDWDLGLICASRTNNLELIELMKNKKTKK